MSAPGRKLAVFRADGSDQMGGGHVMRCLSLAAELAARGFDPLFLCARTTPFLRQRIAAAGAKLVEIEPAPGLLSESPGWDSRRLSPGEQQADAARCREALRGRAPAWTIVDHYRLDRDWEEAFGAPARRLLVIDDLANRPHACAVLVDQTFGRDAGDYAPHVPPGCRVLTGARYAMLRPAFAQARAQALDRRERGGSVRNILISLGTTDADARTFYVVEAAVSAVPDCTLEVVIASTAPSLPRLRELAERSPAIMLRLDVPDMVPLLLQADLAIGAAGTASWERCCLGLPAIVLVLADNQRLIAGKLAEAGAHRIAADCGESLRSQLIALVEDLASRQHMTEVAATIVDGRGIGRIAATMTDAEAEDK